MSECPEMGIGRDILWIFYISSMVYHKGYMWTASLFLHILLAERDCSVNMILPKGNIGLHLAGVFLFKVGLSPFKKNFVYLLQW